MQGSTLSSGSRSRGILAFLTSRSVVSRQSFNRSKAGGHYGVLKNYSGNTIWMFLKIFSKDIRYLIFQTWFKILIPRPIGRVKEVLKIGIGRINLNVIFDNE